MVVLYPSYYGARVRAHARHSSLVYCCDRLGIIMMHQIGRPKAKHNLAALNDNRETETDGLVSPSSSSTKPSPSSAVGDPAPSS